MVTAGKVSDSSLLKEIDVEVGLLRRVAIRSYVEYPNPPRAVRQTTSQKRCIIQESLFVKTYAMEDSEESSSHLIPFLFPGLEHSLLDFCSWAGSRSTSSAGLSNCSISVSYQSTISTALNYEVVWYDHVYSSSPSHTYRPILYTKSKIAIGKRSLNHAQNHARTSRGTWSNLPGSLPVFRWRSLGTRLGTSSVCIILFLQQIL